MKLIYSSSALFPANANPRYLNIILNKYSLKLELWEHISTPLLEAIEGEDQILIEPVFLDSIEIDLEAIFIPNNCFSTMLTHNLTQPTFIDLFNVTEVESTRDAYSLISFFKRANYSTSVNLFFGEVIDDFILTSSLACQCEEIEVKLTNLAPSQIVIDHFPAYSKIIALRNARRELLLAIDPNDSLSYIEAQLDIVTKLILTMLKFMPAQAQENIRGSMIELDEFERVFNNTALFSIKDFSKCLAEISKLKEDMRQRQKKYYERKNKK